MAKKISDEILKVTVIVNGDKAKKELYDLEDANRKLNTSNKELRAEKARLQAQGKKNSQEWKNLNREIRANNQTITKNKERMKVLRDQIGITGLTMAQLRTKAKELRLALQHMTPGSAQFKKLDAELKAIEVRLGQLKRKSRTAAQAIGSIADKMNRYQTMVVSLIASLAGVVVSIQKIIDYNGQLADAQSDVAKTTGLTDKAVELLTSRLGLFKTRSARIELLQLATEAGRLGKKSVDDILAFVQTADKIKVALGDDLQGDVNDNLRVIGKLTEQYMIGSDWGASFAQGMEMIGSAINEVSAQGSNQAGYLVNMLKRLGGVAVQADITADKIIGLAAAADEAGQSEEVVATTLNQLIIGMFQDTEKFAKIAKMELSDFENVLIDDTYQGLLLFLEGLKGNNEGLDDMAKKFDGLGVDGARAVQVLAALANNTGKVKTRQGQANKAMGEGQSLTDEFAKKNENFAAVLAKLQKRIMQIVFQSGFAKWIKQGIIFLAKMVGAVEDADGSATAFLSKLTFLTKALIVAGTAILSYKTSLQLATLWSKRATEGEYLHQLALKAKAIITNGIVAVQALYIIGTQLLTRKITMATAAQRAWNVVAISNPVSAIVAVLGAAIVAYQLYGDEVNHLTAMQRVQFDINKKVRESMAEEKAELNGLLSVARDQKVSLEDRQAAIEKLNELAPEYLGNLTLEKINTMEAKAAIDEYTKSLEAQAMTQALQEKRVELFKKLASAESSSLSDNIQWYEEMWNTLLAGGQIYGAQIRNLKSSIKNRDENIESIYDEIEAMNTWGKELLKNGKLTHERKIHLRELSAEIKELVKEYHAAGSKLSIYQLRTQAAHDLEKKYMGLVESATGKHKDLYQQRLNDIQAYLMAMKSQTHELTEKEKKQIEERLEAQKKIRDFLLKERSNELDQLKAKYDEMIKLAKEYGLETYELEQAFLAEKEALQRLYREKNADAEEKGLNDEMEDLEKWYKARQSLLENYGILTQEELQEKELRELGQFLQEGLITYEEYLKAQAELIRKYRKENEEDHERSEKRILDSRMEYARKAQNFSRVAGDLATSLRDIELAGVQEVTRKKNESEEVFTARKEKEQEKRKKIAKKYAEFEMLTRISSIVANTAESVMKALAELGPIAGPIAAVAMGVTGALQAGIAIKEKNKIQGYEGGYFPVMDHLGRNFAAKRQFNAPTQELLDPTILAGEKPEIIIDPETTANLKQFRPDVIQTIYQMAGRYRGYEEGMYPASTVPSGNDQSVKMIMSALEGNTKAINELYRILAGGIQASFTRKSVRDITKEQRLQQTVEKERKV